MNCGSSKPKYLDQGKKALEGLRDTNSMKVGIQLGEYKLAFDEKMANLNDKPILDEESAKKYTDVKKLQEENDILDKEIELKEKEALVKLSKLMVMAELHSEIKAELNELFDDVGVSHE